jgi:YidC/Oxa1 family membrane protein insertase
MSELFHNLVFVPIYNLLVYLIDIVPGGDVGIAVILATIAVKVALLPLSISVARSQKAMKDIEPRIKELRKQYKDDKERQAKEMFALYKEHDIHPFASFFSILIQLPIIFGLYFVFVQALPNIDPTLLYSFIPIPTTISTEFLGVIAIMSHSFILAGVAAISQFIHAWYAIPVPPPSAEVEGSTSEDIARMMTIQMRYVLPLLIAFIAFSSGAVAVYLITSNVFALAQEFFIRRTGTRPLLVS